MKPGDARVPLPGRWSLRECAPGTRAAELAASAAEWLPIAEPASAAAALRARGAWTLDGAPRNFDASDWWYRNVFDSPRLQAGERAVIGFDGLATLATVWLNGQLLVESDNMFRAHECDVTAALRPAGNELLIRCASLDDALSQRRPRPRWRTPMVAHQQLRWMRTTLLGRTPGWSPPVAGVGPWRDVWLERRGPQHAIDLRLETFMQGAEGVVACSVELPHAAGVEAELRLERGGRSHVLRLVATGAQTLAGELRIADAELWWPHTHGEPALYAATLALRAPGRPAQV
ncbi:MAG: glycoside hydrolase family 2 protein, partial [Comamonadaceae bacterium]